jgi:hypothetical protein
MAPNRTPEKRAKLRTIGEINDEMRRNYRLSVNKKITLAEAQRRNASLALLRNGMSDPVDKAQYTPPPITILSVPSGFLFSHQQLADYHAGKEIIDLAQCEPFTFEPPANTAEERNNVTPLRLAPPKSQPSEEEELRTIADLKSQINELAEKLGLGVVV